MTATRISSKLLTDLSEPVAVWTPGFGYRIPHPNISGMRDDIALVKEILATLEVPPSEKETVQSIQKIIHDITSINEMITEKLKGLALSVGIPTLMKTWTIEKTLKTLLEHADNDPELKNRKKLLLDGFRSIDLNKLNITGDASKTAVAGLIDVFTITMRGFDCMEPYGLKPDSNLPLLITGLSEMLEKYVQPLPCVVQTPPASLKTIPRGKFDDEEDFSEDEEIEPHFWRSSSLASLKMTEERLRKDNELKTFQLIFKTIQEKALALSLEAKKIGLDHSAHIRLCIHNITTANNSFKSLIDNKTVTHQDFVVLKLHCEQALENKDLINEIKAPLAAKLRQILWALACYLALPFQKMVKLARSHGRTSTVYDKVLPAFFSKTPLEMTLEKTNTEIRSLVLSPSNGMGSE